MYDHPVNLFVAGFIGSPPMNLARGTIEGSGDGLHVRIGSSTIPVLAELSASAASRRGSGRR